MTVFKIWKKTHKAKKSPNNPYKKLHKHCEDEGKQAHTVLYFQFRTHMEHCMYFKLGVLIGPVCFKGLQILQWTFQKVNPCSLDGWRKVGLPAPAQPEGTGRCPSSKSCATELQGFHLPPKPARVREMTSHNIVNSSEIWEINPDLNPDLCFTADPHLF